MIKTHRKVSKPINKKAKKSVAIRKHVPKTLNWLAEVGYSETAGLYPQKSAMAGAKASVYDKTTWDKNSFHDLQTSRAHIMSVAQRNPIVGTAGRPGKNRIEQQAWKYILDAAKFSKDHHFHGNYFFIRQLGVGNQKPPKGAKYGQGDPLISYGPFRNVGGGGVAKGDKTFIDIYDN